MPTPRIVPEFDVPHNVTARMLTGRILGAMNPLVLQCSEERFGHCIVIADPGAADGLAKGMPLPRRRELEVGVIAAAIRVKDGIPGERIIAGGHPDGLLDERGLVIIVRRPA